MKKIVIEGPSKLSGTINLQGSKNAILINLVLPILTDEECIISNVPRIRDVEVNLDILAKLGGKVQWLGDHTVSIKCDNLRNANIDPGLAVRTTSSKFFIPLLVKRFGRVTTGRSLGDNIGLDRGFSKFIKQLEEVGIRNEKEGNSYTFYLSEETKGCKEVSLIFPSFSATVGTILAHVLGNRTFKLKNAHLASEIDNAFNMLNSMGARIKSNGSTVEVAGVEKLRGTNFRNQSDRNALITYITASLITNGDVTINNVDDEKLEPFWEFLESVGAKYHRGGSFVHVFPSKDKLQPAEVFAFIWPKFHSDWQPLAGVLMTQVRGASSIIDDLWEHRLGYWEELGKMGAKYELFKPENSRFKDDEFHGVKIFGPASLRGTEVTASDIRGGGSLVLAGLAAEGKTTIENIGQIERGYEEIVGVLSSLGANIRYED